MKPADWDDMSRHEQEEYAHALMNSVRGRYIIGQALAIASDTLAKHPFPETSNIQDMEVLGHHPSFTMGYTITLGLNEVRKAKETLHASHQSGTGER